MFFRNFFLNIWGFWGSMFLQNYSYKKCVVKGKVSVFCILYSATLKKKYFCSRAPSHAALFLFVDNCGFSTNMKHVFLLNIISAVIPCLCQRIVRLLCRQSAHSIHIKVKHHYHGTHSSRALSKGIMTILGNARRVDPCAMWGKLVRWNESSIETRCWPIVSIPADSGRLPVCMWPTVTLTYFTWFLFILNISDYM